MLPEIFGFQIKTKVHYGAGQLAELGELASRLPAKKWLLVTDGPLVKLGFVDRVRAGMESGSSKIGAVFDGVLPNSEVKIVEAGAALAKKQKCDGVIGLGGGSALDTAKAIAILMKHGGKLLDYEGAQNLPGALVPLVAIPTTAGTGSEVTNCAVVLDEAGARKVSFLDDHMLPDLALLDPELTYRLPARITAATGMDALTHAVEAFVDRQNSPFSDALALEAIRLIATYLVRATAKGADDPEARGGMMVASNLAGIAFNHSMVGIIHGISHTLGGIFHCAHGEANAVVLPHGMRFNLEAEPDRFARIGWAMGVSPKLTPAKAAHAGIDKVFALRGELAGLCGLPQTLTDLKVDVARLDEVAERSMEEGSMLYNPRDVEVKDVRELLKAAR